MDEGTAGRGLAPSFPPERTCCVPAVSSLARSRAPAGHRQAIICRKQTNVQVEQNVQERDKQFPPVSDKIGETEKIVFDID